MARKGNQQKNGLDRQSSNHKKGASDSGSALPNTKRMGNLDETKVGAVDEHELSNGSQPNLPSTENANKANHVGDKKKSKQKSGKFPRQEKQVMDETQGLGQTVFYASSSGDGIRNVSTMEDSGFREENGTSPTIGLKSPKSSLGHSLNGLHRNDTAESVDFSQTMAVQRLKTLVLSILNASTEWLERQRPMFINVTAKIFKARNYVRMKIEYAYPVVLRWIMHFGNIMLLLSMVWLDCTLRGIDSFLRMGTTSIFAVIWCSTLSLVAMIGMSKFLIVLALAALIGFFVGFTLAILLTAISGVVFLWLYGNFWTTMLVIFSGGVAFMFSHERLALLITTVYSVYCAWTSVGWLGLLLGLNLSFISSDALIYFLRNNMNEHRRPNMAAPEQAAGMQGGPGIFFGEQVHASSSETGGLPADRSQGVPSTSGSDSDITSEDEVVRLLNCTDHYSALGLSRFENVDVSLLKREYRKKAMLVHPDKNMGNEKAAEAFKKLQNAYEILLDSFKRKAYDDELRREELLNYFRRFQNASQKDSMSQNRGNGFFASTFGRTEADVDDPLGESRRIACRKCTNFHVWFHTNKSKSRARWCQDCKDFHQAKDGDGWVEQSSQPFFFGILQKVDSPCAYVCADGKIYDATEWYICQGMRCPVNTHKPSFHVNTSVTSKHSNGKATSNSAQRGGGGIPTPNMEETMTEDEFLAWLQNAVQAGMFDNFAGGSSDSPSTQPGSTSKSGSAAKRKKKGKKQR